MVNEIPQSHIRLATTATAGSGGEHSPYYRRMLSAGYKGLIQGTIGGATLYGTFGAAIGLILAVSTFPFWGAGAFAAVPVLTAAGLLKGAGTFGQIGAHAAIYAEGAEMNERRRALLDRLQTTKSQNEADHILELLHEEGKEHAPKKVFHWKALLVGAALGGLATLLILSFPPAAEALHFIIGPLAEAIPSVGGLNLAHTVLTATGAAIGALAGATIGLDRYYIRKWFDVSEDMVHDGEKARAIALERQREAKRLHEISKTDTPNPNTGIDARSVTPDASINTPNQVYKEDDDPTRPRVRVNTNGAEVTRLKSVEEMIQVPAL